MICSIVFLATVIKYSFLMSYKIFVTEARFDVCLVDWQIDGLKIEGKVLKSKKRVVIWQVELQLQLQ